MEYSKEFEAWWEKSRVDFQTLAKSTAYSVYKSVIKNRYAIGEKVEALGLDGWKSAVVTATRDGIGFTEMPEDVRPIRSYKPKEGDAVLFNDHGTTKVGLYMDEWITSRDRKTNPECYEFIKLTPADTDKIGKPWNEI